MNNIEDFLKQFENGEFNKSSKEEVDKSRDMFRDVIGKFTDAGYDIEEACALIRGLYEAAAHEVKYLIELWTTRILSEDEDEDQHSIN